jgi:homoserine kinase
VFTVRVPATLSNLGPGYDVLGLALSIHNVFRFTEAAEWAADGAPVDPDTHLCLRTARAASERFGGVLPCLAVEQDEQVPRSRGLGSSATARVAGLLAWAHISGRSVSLDEQIALLAEGEGHPDNVVPALVGGLTLCAEVEGAVRHLRLDPPALRVALAVPEVQVETAAARRLLPERVPHADAVFNVARVGWLLAGLLGDDPEAVAIGLHDRLHQPYRSELIGPVEEAFAAARDAGAMGAFISGSGSTLAAFVSESGDAPRVAGALCAPFTAAGVPCRPRVAVPVAGGALVG